MMSETMTPEEQQLTMLRGIIAGLPDETQKAIKARADRLREIVADDGDGEPGVGRMALALVGAEGAAAEDD